MTTTSAAQWRRRCLAAEERVEAAERTAKRWRSKAERQANQIAELTDALEGVHAFAKQATRVLERRARRDLGEGCSDEEVRELVSRWLADDRKRTTKRQQINVVVISPEEMLRRLGFRTEEDDES